jgi:hypothetical protein
LLIRYSRGGVGDDGAGKQQEGVGGLPVHVEIVAGSKQEQVAETQRGECVVKHAHYGKEYEERETIEQHAFSDNKLTTDYTDQTDYSNSFNNRFYGLHGLYRLQWISQISFLFFLTRILINWPRARPLDACVVERSKNFSLILIICVLICDNS